MEMKAGVKAALLAGDATVHSALEAWKAHVEILRSMLDEDKENTVGEWFDDKLYNWVLRGLSDAQKRTPLKEVVPELFGENLVPTIEFHLVNHSGDVKKAYEEGFVEYILQGVQKWNILLDTF